MQDLPPLESVRVFEVAARHESFVKAGQELGVTAATVSNRIQALETRMGARLFTRSTRGVRLNSRGRAYGEEIRGILGEIGAATDRHREHTGAKRLKLVTVEVVAEKWLMPRLADFKAAHPDISIEFETDHREVDPERRDFDIWIAFTGRVAQDAAGRNAVRGVAAAGLQPGTPEGAATAPETSGSAPVAAAVRPALGNLLVALVRATRRGNRRSVTGVGVPALQHDGAGRGRRDGRRPRPFLDDLARVGAGNTRLPVRLACHRAGPPSRYPSSTTTTTRAARRSQ